MAINFLNKGTGTIEPNIFIQNNEPTVKNGIWIKSNNFAYSNITEVEDESSLVANSINIIKGATYETIVLNSNIVNGLHYKFNSVIITDENNDIDYTKNIYYGNDTSWIDITPAQGHIYGIKRLRNSSSSAWQRTDEGVGLIANATHDGTAVQNDFDNLSPWKDIISFNYDHSQNLVTAYYGDDGFSFVPENTKVNVFTKIPQFWYKRWIDEDDYEHIQIADYAASGFLESKEFAAGRYPFQGSTSTPRSISGLAPLTNTSGEDYKTATLSMGNNFCLLDWKALGAIQFLYLVEYADYNSQDKLGYGICGYELGENGKTNSGQLDNLGMKSGCLNNDKFHSVSYRGIEDIFGHIFQLIDGVNINNSQAYVCDDYTKYEFEKYDEDYEQIGYVNASSEGFISKMGLDENYPLLMLPIGSDGNNENDYITDYYVLGTGNQAFRYGGNYVFNLKAGFFCVACNTNASNVSIPLGTRLLLRQNG